MKVLMDYLIGEFVEVLIEGDFFGRQQRYSGALLGEDEEFIYLGHYKADRTPVVKYVISKKQIKMIEKEELKQVDEDETPEQAV